MAVRAQSNGQGIHGNKSGKIESKRERIRDKGLNGTRGRPALCFYFYVKEISPLFPALFRFAFLNDSKRFIFFWA